MLKRSWRRGTYQTTTFMAAVVLLIVLFVTVGYFFVIPEPGFSDERQELLAELDERLDYWESRRPIAFRYVLDRDCECPGGAIEPYQVTEDANERSAVYAAERYTEGPETRRPDMDEVLFIDAVFDHAKAAVLDADEVSVSFDPRFGFPSVVKIDRTVGSIRTREVINVRDFEVISLR